MLVIEPRYKEGSGFGSIFRKLFSAGTKKIIKKAVTPKVAQKLAKAAVTGATKGTKTLVENSIAGLKKRALEAAKEEGGHGLQLTPARKKFKIDISKEVINSGAGIVLD